MRARSIKPGFYKNEELTECSPWARLLFPGLWMMADREGRLENRPKRIKNEIFPSDSLDVAALLYELETHGLIKTYTVDGCAYIWIVKFCEHQRPHQNEVASIIPNYPSTDEALSPMVEGLATKVESTSLLITSSLDPSSLTPESISLDLDTSCAHLSEAERTAPDEIALEPSIFLLPLNTGDQYPVTESALCQLEPLYPAVNVREEFRKMLGWFIGNPTKRKTKKGIMRFVTSWLSKAQDRGGGMAQGQLGVNNKPPMTQEERDMQKWLAAGQARN